jgi:polyisoprenoid-binding protein YceI
MQTLRRLLLLLPAVAFATAAGAQEARYALDRDHTLVRFAVSHFGFTMMQGWFREVDGSLVLDRDRPERSELRVSLPSASIDMNHAALNDHLRSADFLDAARHPAVSFRSTWVERTGEATALVHGELMLRGVAHPLTLEARLSGGGTHPVTHDEVVGFHAAGRLKRSAFGMTFLIPEGIGDDVEIAIASEWLRR